MPNGQSQSKVNTAAGSRRHQVAATVTGGAALDWDGLRRLEPVSRVFGLDRGTPIDRYYIERFLERHAGDVRGRVLEVAEDTYTRRFGGSRVAKADILYSPPGHPRATLVADLAMPTSLPADVFDCIILTQTLLCIYDGRATLANCLQALKPDGVLLATFPGISQISRYDMDRWGDYWRFTTRSAARLFGEFFSSDRMSVAAYGNVLAAVAFLHGLAMEDIQPHELDYCDPDYELLITVRAVKEAG